MARAFDAIGLNPVTHLVESTHLTLDLDLALDTLPLPFAALLCSALLCFTLSFFLSFFSLTVGPVSVTDHSNLSLTALSSTS
jgi:hypothetical protein